VSDVDDLIRLQEEEARQVCLFDAPGQKVYLVEPGRRGRFRHSFGGPPRHEGAVPPRRRRPLHLVYSLDLSDPRVGVTIPGIRLLPLYHGFAYQDGDVGYQVLADDRIRVFRLGSRRGRRNSPDKNYPLPEFPRVAVSVEETVFDPSDPEAAAAFIGVFGVDRVPERTRPKLRKLLARWYRRQEDLFEGPDEGPPETLEELAQLFDFPFQQGRPDSPCPDPRCENHGKAGSMRVLALVGSSPVPGVALWGESGEGVQLIFEICPLCRAICTSNQCD
jgi:hypothetical protein